MKKLIFATLAAVALCIAAVTTLWLQQAPSSNVNYKPSGPQVAPSLLATTLNTASTAHGQLTLGERSEPLLLVYLGFTHCPDICPAGLSIMSTALKALTPTESAKVFPLFVSVDPERDSPEHLKAYTEFFHPQLVGATADKPTLDPFVKGLGAYYRLLKETPEQTDYSVEHSASFYIINRESRAVVLMPHSSTPKQLAEALRKGLSTQ